MNTEKEVINFAAETLTGDIRDFLVDRLRNFPKVWAQMTEDEQENEIEAATKAADNLVSRAVKIIASEGRRTVPATLDKITLKDGCKCELSTSKGWISELAGALNLSVLIVTNSSDEFTGERAPCKADPDEPELFDGDAEEKAAEEEQPDEKDFLGVDGDDGEAA